VLDQATCEEPAQHALDDGAERAVLLGEVQKSIPLMRGHKVELSGDVFNLFNSSAATDFLSKDLRSSLFTQPTNYVPARVGQIGIRTTF
jgi:hypothetical protein